MMSRFTSAFCSIFLSIFFVGCSTFGPSCMRTSLVADESTVPLSRAIKGDKRVVTISAFKAGCGGSSDQIPGKEGDIGISLTLTSPESTHSVGDVRTVSFPLFVALLDKVDNVIDRRDETVVVRVSREPLVHVHQIIYHPPSGIGVESEDHRILVGFNGNVKAVKSSVKVRPSAKKPSPPIKKKCKGKSKRKKKLRKRY